MAYFITVLSMFSLDSLNYYGYLYCCRVRKISKAPFFSSVRASSASSSCFLRLGTEGCCFIILDIISAIDGSIMDVLHKGGIVIKLIRAGYVKSKYLPGIRPSPQQEGT